MKIIQLTDIHYGNKKEAIYGREPSFTLSMAIESINTKHNDADFCIITGDITHHGSLEAYRYLKSDLDNLKMPYYVLLGNHDERAHALKVFSHLKSDENGFVQYSFVYGHIVFLMLDTLQGHDENKKHAGFYCKKRLDWLRNKLETYKNHDVYIALHHAPFNTGLLAMDSMRLNQKDSINLYKTLQNHKHIRHIFFGHYHSTLAGKWGDFSFSSLKGISHQVKLDLIDKENVWLDFKNPEYSVVLIDKQSPEEPATICVHYEDFMFDRRLYIKESIN